jgi:hypothetical protein
MSDDAFSKYDASLIDVYAFGILMWEVLARERPFHLLLQTRRVRHFALSVQLLYEPFFTISFSLVPLQLGLFALRDLIYSGERPSLYEDDLGQDDGGDDGGGNSGGTAAKGGSRFRSRTATTSGPEELEELAMAPRDAILLMQRCWHHNPAKRPLFEEIHGLLLATETALGLEEVATESGQVLRDKQLEKGPPPRETGRLNNSMADDGPNERAMSAVLCMNMNPMLAAKSQRRRSQRASGWITATQHDLPPSDDGDTERQPARSIAV